ncbi:MAG: biopolymer transporter ExbD [Pseudomonadota bacterium]
MRFKSTREEDLTIGIAPLIDIVFLLLIFFMVTSHFDVVSNVPVRLPKVTKKLYDVKADKVILAVDGQGRAFIGGQMLDMGSLQKKLEEIKKEKGPFHLILQADKDVRHGRVVEIMDAAKTAGVDSILIAARWRSEKIL